VPPQTCILIRSLTSSLRARLSPLSSLVKCVTAQWSLYEKQCRGCEYRKATDFCLRYCTIDITPWCHLHGVYFLPRSEPAVSTHQLRLRTTQCGLTKLREYSPQVWFVCVRLDGPDIRGHARWKPARGGFSRRGWFAVVFEKNENRNMTGKKTPVVSDASECCRVVYIIRQQWKTSVT
jgi:hypothetical protein